MQIIHILNPFFYTIFPELAGKSKDDLVHALKVYYSYGPYKPKVSVLNETVTIELDKDKVLAQEADYRKVLTLCERKNFNEAKALLIKLIADNPTVSEYHRVMGQILSEQGDQDGAIDHLIDALRWDSHNGWALLMMGNIFAKYKKDIDTAIKYCDQAMASNTADHISLTNAAYLAFSQKRLFKASDYIEKALSIKEDYPNALSVKAMICDARGEDEDAFEYYIKAIQSNHQKDQVWKNAFDQAVEIAKRILATNTGDMIIELYSKKLEYLGEKEIHVEIAPDIATPAKMEFGENHNRPFHLIRYKDTYPAVEHLIMHEMVHLEFVLDARKDGVNQLFTSHDGHKKEFMKLMESMKKQLIGMGFDTLNIKKFTGQIFEGLNTLMYNVPIDLFIEDLLYREYKALRPYQFISLHQLTYEGINAVTDKKITEIIPKTVISKTKILNMVGAMQYRDLYGIDLLDKYGASKIERTQAESFYDEYQEYRKDKSPGEEYELIQHWAEDLQINGYFQLKDEAEYRTKSDLDKVLQSIEDDPYDLESDDPEKEREMEKFLESQDTTSIQMNIVMFMIGAKNYLKDLSKEKIKEVALEIAQAGIHGIDPNQDGYKVANLPGKKFSGSQLLAWCYVSWAMAIPEMVASLQLPYDREYEVAKGMVK
jgi:tetratricopeptide (TPR) repeat protein